MNPILGPASLITSVASASASVISKRQTEEATYRWNARTPIPSTGLGNAVPLIP